ncbi:hypothetical protein J437_LFUL011957 [Ladona fulva]|uniref:Uncharacterized protein n=1 Tax=Ladona fulva TaxID=123851 RepID=A0A8K0KDC8_LADFU|nr:hypothetical protein J437_LFUL011957 [Ladona fulva]
MDFFRRLNCIECYYDDSASNEGGVSLNINERVSSLDELNSRDEKRTIEKNCEKEQSTIKVSQSSAEFKMKFGNSGNSVSLTHEITRQGNNADFSKTSVLKDYKYQLPGPMEALLLQDAKKDHCIMSGDSGEEDGKMIMEFRDYLMTLECPFTWTPDKDGAACMNGEWIFDDNERDGDEFVEHLTLREHEFRLVKKNIFRKLCVHLVLAYEKALLGKLTSAVEHIEQSRILVTNTSDNSSELQITRDRKNGIYHVLMATITHIYYLQKLYKEASEAAKLHAQNYSNLSQEAKAMVHGLHGGVLMEYGYRGNRLALVPVRAAIELDPNCWLWRLFLGKILGRFRRMAEFNMPVGVEELSSIRLAAELQPEAQCISHLADVYKQLYAVITHQGVMPKDIDKILTRKEIESLPKMAHDLYIKAAILEPNCPYNNARSAKGLLSLPVPFKDLDLAETYIVRALHLAPNDSMVNHYAGFYYETRREFDQALASYRKALITSGGSLSGSGSGVGNFPAELGYLSLQHRLDLGEQEWPNNQIGGAGIRAGRYPNIQGGGGIST